MQLFIKEVLRLQAILQLLESSFRATSELPPTHITFGTESFLGMELVEGLLGLVSL